METAPIGDPHPPAAVVAATGDGAWEPLPGARPVDGSMWEVGNTVVVHRGPRPQPLRPPGRDVARDRPGPDVEADGHRLVAARFPGASVEVVDGHWLVIAVEGEAAHRPDRHPEPGSLPERFGAALRRFHDLPTPSAAGGRSGLTHELLVAELDVAVRAGAVERGLLPAPYDRYHPEQLLELIAAGPPPADDLVFGHGWPVPANFRLDDDEVVAVTGLARWGPADRHHDLAVAHRALVDGLGPQSVFGFYHGYGLDPDLVRLDHHLLIEAVASAVRPGPVSEPSGPRPADGVV